MNTLIGLRSADAYGSLVRSNARISIVYVTRYASPPLLQQRVPITSYEEGIIELALEIREQSKIPFWEAIFAACLKTNSYSEALLEATIFQNSLSELVECSRQDVLDGKLHSILAKEPKNIGLASLVRLETGEVRHFNMIDFHCDVSEANTNLVTSICHKLMPTGFIVLNSGDSYHACSTSPCTPRKRIEVLGTAILFAPIVDTIYIAHQLRQEYSSLRLSRGGKMKQVPIVVSAA